MTETKKRVTVIGPINADILTVGDYQGDWQTHFEWESPAQISLCTAGSAGYTLQDFNKLGSYTRIFSSIGDDSIGAALRSDMERQGIDTTCLFTHPDSNTAIGVYWLMHGNKKRPLAYQMSDFSPWPQVWDAEIETSLLSADLLHCGGYLHYPSMFFGKTAELYRKAKDRGIITSIDTQFPLIPGKTLSPWLQNMTDILPYVDVLIMDENEARAFTGRKDVDEAVSVLAPYPLKVIVVKFGSEGSRIYSQEGMIQQPAIHVGETLDTIGAGDAYGAAFLTYYMEGRSISECARFAAVVAGFTVTKLGGYAGMPDRETAERYVREHG